MQWMTLIVVSLGYEHRQVPGALSQDKPRIVQNKSLQKLCASNGSTWLVRESLRRGRTVNAVIAVWRDGKAAAHSAKAASLSWMKATAKGAEHRFCARERNPSEPILSR